MTITEKLAYIKGLCEGLKLDDSSKEGKILVIRPSEFVDISRTETDRKIMQEMYNLGIKDAENKLNEIIDYLNK